MGVMCHDLLANIFSACFARWDDHPEGDDMMSEDLRLQLKQKAWRAVRCLSDWTFKRRCMVTNFVAAPLDHLMLHIQHADEQGSVLRDIMWDHSNPFSMALRKMSLMVEENPLDGPLRTLFYHFSVDPSEAEDGFVEASEGLPGEVRSLVVSMASQTWWRFHFEAWPFLLVRLVDVRTTEPDRKLLAGKLFQAHACDVDPLFLQPIAELV